MSQPIEEKMFDIRVVERNMRAGKITAEEYQKFLESLPDDAEHAEPSKVRFGSDDDR